MQWYNSTLRMHLHKGLASDDFDNREDMYYMQFKDNLPDQDWIKVYVMEILDVMHHWTDVKMLLASSGTFMLNKRWTF